MGGISGKAKRLEPGAASSPNTISVDGLATGAGASRGIGCSVFGAVACPAARPQKSVVAIIRPKRFVKNSKSLGISGVSWSIDYLQHPRHRRISSEKEHTAETAVPVGAHGSAIGVPLVGLESV